MINIKKATIADAASISDLGHTTFTETFGELFADNGDLPNYLEQTYSLQKISDSLSKSNNVFFLAFFEDVAVGYAKLKTQSPSPFLSQKAATAQLQKIYVRKEFLSLKAGHALQQAVFDSAQESGAKKIWLSVYEGNKRAIRFYEKNGFERIGQHDFTIGSHDFLFWAMAKSF